MGIGTALNSFSKGFMSGENHRSLEKQRAQTLLDMKRRSERASKKDNWDDMKRTLAVQQVLGVDEKDAERVLSDIADTKEKYKSLAVNTLDKALLDSGKGEYDAIRGILTNSTKDNPNLMLKQSLEQELGGTIIDVDAPDPDNIPDDLDPEEAISNDMFEVTVLKPDGSKAKVPVSGLQLGAMVGTPNRVGVEKFNRDMTQGYSPKGAVMTADKVAGLMSISFDGKIQDLTKNMTIAATYGSKDAKEFLYTLAKMNAKDDMTLAQVLAKHLMDNPDDASAKAQYDRLTKLIKKRTLDKEKPIDKAQRLYMEAVENSDPAGMRKYSQVLQQFKQGYGVRGSDNDVIDKAMQQGINPFQAKQALADAKGGTEGMVKLEGEKLKLEVQKGLASGDPAQMKKALQTLMYNDPKTGGEFKARALALSAKYNGNVPIEELQKLYESFSNDMAKRDLDKYQGKKAIDTSASMTLKDIDQQYRLQGKAVDQQYALQAKALVQKYKEHNDKTQFERDMDKLHEEYSLKGDAKAQDYINDINKMTYEQVNKLELKKADAKKALENTDGSTEGVLKAFKEAPDSDTAIEMLTEDVDKLMTLGKTNKQGNVAAQAIYSSISSKKDFVKPSELTGYESKADVDKYTRALYNLQSKATFDPNGSGVKETLKEVSSAIRLNRTVGRITRAYNKLLDIAPDAFTGWKATGLTRVAQTIQNVLGIAEDNIALEAKLDQLAPDSKEFKEILTKLGLANVQNWSQDAFLTMKGMLKDLSGMGVTNKELETYSEQLIGGKFDSIPTMVTKLTAVATRAVTDVGSNLELVANQGGYGTAYEYGNNLARSAKWRIDAAKADYDRTKKTTADKRAFINTLKARGVPKRIVEAFKSRLGV